jgi:hypothetical protein
MIRIHIYGFSIDELKSYEGSKNQEVLKKVLDELYDGDDPELDEYTKAREIAKLFFNESAKEAGFNNETRSYYYFIRACVYVLESSKSFDIDCSSEDLFDYLYNIRNNVSVTSKQLINFFIIGRSIFSDQSALSPSDYPYIMLSLSEISTLIKDIKKNSNLYKDQKGVSDKFYKILKELEENKMDLYMNVS